MSLPAPRELLRAIYQHLDRDALYAKYPDLTRQDLDDFFMRLVETAAGRVPRAEKPLPPGAETAATTEPAPEGFDLIVHADGSSRGNPGPAGIAAVLFDAAGGPLGEVARPIGRATNNVAEYHAVLAGLDEALRLGARRVLLRTDSELLVRQLRGEYRVKNAALQTLHERVRRLAGRFQRFACEHVPRERNARADALAARASKAGAAGSSEAGAATRRTRPPRRDGHPS